MGAIADYLAAIASQDLPSYTHKSHQFLVLQLVAPSKEPYPLTKCGSIPAPHRTLRIGKLDVDSILRHT